MAVGNRGYINNYSATLSAGIDSSTTSIPVVDGAPVATALATHDYVALTLDDGTSIEIVHATASASNVLTVQRGQEGTSGTAFVSGTTIEVRATADSFNVANLTGVDFSAGAPSTDDQLKFDAGGNLIAFTPSGGGGGGMWELVSTQTLASHAATILFDVPDSSAAYMIVFRGVACTVVRDVRLQIAYDVAGTPTYATTEYRYVVKNMRDTTTPEVIARSASAGFVHIGTDVANNLNGHITMYSKQGATNTKPVFKIETSYIDNTSQAVDSEGSAVYNNSTNTPIQLKLLLSGSGSFWSGSVFHLFKRTV